jgi:SRSO17 transposase
MHAAKSCPLSGCYGQVPFAFVAANELGLDHNESRSWHGWHRHALVMLAFAMMAAIRHHANAAPLKKTLPRLLKGRHS